MQTQPAVTPMYIQTEGKPENYLLLSVLNMVLCCFLCGLIALIYSLRVRGRGGTPSHLHPGWHSLLPHLHIPSLLFPTPSAPSALFLPFPLFPLFLSSQVDSAWNTGDREGAKRAAQTAKNWNIVGIVSGIITIVLTVIISVVVGVVVPFVVFRSLRG